MKIEKISLDKLKMHENNAKEHPDWQVEQIMRSIQEFGFNDPIAVDENNEIIEGHGRYLALKELGIESCECIRLSHLNENQKRAYIIAHNKLTMNTGFNAEILAYEMNALKVDEFDLSVLGFGEAELNSIFNNFEDHDKDEKDEPEIIQPEKKMITCPFCGEEFEK